MARASWLLGAAFLMGCTSPDVSVSVAVKVEPTENHEQYLFDVMVESDGELIAHPKILVEEGQPGEVRIEQDGGGKFVLNVVASGPGQESDR